MKKLILCALVALLLVPFSAFAGGGPDRGDGRPRVAISLLPITNDWHAAVREYVNGAMARHPNIDWNPVWATSPAHQVDVLQQMLTARYDAVIIIPADGVLVTPIAEAIYATGTRTIIVNRPLLPGARYTAMVTGDNYGGGVNAARLLGQRLGPGNHNVGILRFGVGHPIDEERLRGFAGTIVTEFPNIRVIGQIEGGFNRSTGLTAMETFLVAHPHIDAMFTMDDEAALGAITAVRAAGRTDIRFMTGFGGALEAYQLLAANDPMFIGSMTYFPRMIIDAVEMTARILRGESFPRDTFIPSHTVHSGNVQQFMPYAIRSF
jgi:ribose transport system substrate-binding protein